MGKIEKIHPTALDLVKDEEIDAKGEAGIPANTRRAYQGDWRRFYDWCHEQGVPPLPASARTVKHYLSHLDDLGRRVATLDRAFAVIAVFHKAAGVHPLPTSDEGLRVWLRGIRNLRGRAPSKRPPVRVRHLADIVQHLPTTLQAYRDKAVMLLGFAIAGRRSEIVALSTFDVELEKGGLRVHIRRSKTDQEGIGRTVTLARSPDSHLCPVAALQEWLLVSGIQEGPLFRQVDRWGSLHDEQLHPQAVADIVKRCMTLTDVDNPQDYAGHSLRSGCISEAVAAGVPEWQIAQITGHKSTRVLRGYIEQYSRFEDSPITSILNLEH